MAKYNRHITKKCFKCGFRDNEVFVGEQKCKKCGAEYKNLVGGNEYSLNELYDDASGNNIDTFYE